MEKIQKKGFTLIELLVVIAIIGILSAIGLVSLNGAREKARDSQARSDLATFRTSLVLYYDDHNSTYPGTVTTAAANVSHNSAGTGATANSVWDAAGPVIVEYLAAMKSPSSTNRYGYRASNFVAGATSGAGAFVVYYQLEGAGGTYFYSVDSAGNVRDVAQSDTAIEVCTPDASGTQFNGTCTQS